MNWTKEASICNMSKWGEVYNKGVAKGEDHSSAAQRADDSESRYLSAVKGRRDFRQAYSDEREKTKQLEARVHELGSVVISFYEAVNPPDRSGISMQEWNERLKAASQKARDAWGSDPVPRSTESEASKRNPDER